MIKNNKEFILWMIGLAECFTIEIFFNISAGIVNLGIISAIFLIYCFYRDKQEDKKCQN
jgi:hypothetical protein